MRPKQLNGTPEGVKRYQLMVVDKDPETRVEKEIRVGPILQFKDVLEENAAAINIAVAEGREKRWSNARVVEIDKIVSS